MGVEMKITQYGQYFVMSMEILLMQIFQVNSFLGHCLNAPKHHIYFC